MIACPKPGVGSGVSPIAFLATRDISDKTSAVVGTLIAILVIWVASAWAMSRSVLDRDPPRPRRPSRPGLSGRLRRWSHLLNPVVITQDAMGFGSTSRLQVFFFTLIVVATLTYVFLRAGYLSEISVNLLVLMGITGVSTAATKLVANDRAAREDEVTFATTRWLSRHGIVFPPRAPLWRDLVMSGREFNIFNFQALVFSILVGLSILSSAMQNLADLTIPANLMTLLGLSQALYVSGKAIGSAGGPRKELNNAVSRATASETRLLQMLPIDSPFRKAAQERGQFGPEQRPTLDAPLPSKDAADALRVFELDSIAVISLATEVLGGERRRDDMQRTLLPVDPPDDTFSVPAWSAGFGGPATAA